MNPITYKKFLAYLELSTTEDAAQGSNIDLSAHDRRFHPNGFNKDTDHCSLRDALNANDRGDNLQVSKRQPKFNKPLFHADAEFPQKIEDFSVRPDGTAIVTVGGKQYVFTAAGGASGAVKGRLPGKDGQMHTFFAKHPLSGSSRESVANEYLANSLIRMAGFNAPDSSLYDVQGTPVMLTREVEGVIGNIGDVLDSENIPWDAKKKIKSQMRKSYPLHAWLYNTDMNRYGILVDSDYNVHFVDNGSAFMFRGGGDLKDDKWVPKDGKRKPWRGGNFADREDAHPDAVDAYGNPSGIDALYNNQYKRWHRYCGSYEPDKMLRKAAHIDFPSLLNFVKAFNGLKNASINGISVNPGELPSFDKWTRSLAKASREAWNATHSYGKTSAEDAVDLTVHDAKYHPNGFNPETDRCSVREEEFSKMAKEDVIPTDKDTPRRTSREELLSVQEKIPSERDWKGAPMLRVNGLDGLRGDALLDKVYEKAEENLGTLEGLVLSAAKKVGGELKTRPLNKAGQRMKDRKNAKDKADRWCLFAPKHGGDYSQLNDIIGATLVMPSDKYDNAVNAVKASLPAGCTLEKVKPYMTKELSGYRDCKLGIRFPNGGLGEVIIIEPQMNDAKFERGGHTIYEVHRAFVGFEDESPAAKSAAEKLHRLSDMVYADASAAPSREEFQKVKKECLGLLQAARAEPAKYGLPEDYFTSKEKGEHHSKTWKHVLDAWDDVRLAGETKSGKVWSA